MTKEEINQTSTPKAEESSKESFKGIILLSIGFVLLCVLG